MKIKEVQAGVKITKNYNSYQISLTAEIETGENPEIIGAQLMEKASDIVKKQTDMVEIKGAQNIRPTVNREVQNKGIEVGGAWPDKKFANKLSAKDSDGKWRSINLNALEKIPEGYKYKNNEGTFILRKLQKEERTNDKMPLYRIYKIEE